MNTNRPLEALSRNPLALPRSICIKAAGLVGVVFFAHVFPANDRSDSKSIKQTALLMTDLVGLLQVVCLASVGDTLVRGYTSRGAWSC